MHIIQTPLFDFDTFITKKGNDRLVMVLAALPAEVLIATLEREHWTGRNDYSVRGMWSALIAGLLGQAVLLNLGCSTLILASFEIRWFLASPDSVPYA